MAERKKTDLVRVGVVGAGIGQAHIKGYCKVPEARVVAVCDVDEARARQTAHDCGAQSAVIYTDYQVMLRQAGVDAVSVCVPNSLHRPVAVNCLDAGKHVLCEKPLAINAAEATKIAAAAQRNNVKCMVAQVRRFQPEAQFLKQVIASGELGRLYYAHTGVLRKRGIPGYGGWFTTKEMSGGGPLIDLGVHFLDIAWWLCGCPRPLSVTGATYAELGPRGIGAAGAAANQKPQGTFDVEDLAVAFISFEGGLTINLEVSWALHQERDRQWCQIFGSEGGCDLTDHATLYRDINGVAANSRLEVPKGDAWQRETAHFINCILQDTKPDPDAAQGVTMMKMLDAVYKSAQTGRAVKIEDKG